MEHLRLIRPSIEYKEAGIDYINEHYIYNSLINGSGGLDRHLNDYEGWLNRRSSNKQIHRYNRRKVFKV